MTSTAAGPLLSGTEWAVQPEIVDVPMRSFLAIDGTGAPASADYRRAVLALEAVSEAARDVVAHRGRLPVHEIAPLETMWARTCHPSGAGTWSWTALVEQPAGVTGDIVVVARIKVVGSVPAATLSQLRWWHWREGRSAQLLHPGGFHGADSARRRLDDFIQASGHRPRGRYHEVCLGRREGQPVQEWTVLRRQVGPGAV